MELRDALRARRMVRSFADQAIDPATVDDLLTSSLRVPSAGNTRGTAWVVLRGPDETARYWDHATTEEWRATSRRWPGLRRAPVICLAMASPDAYVDRYAEPDKAASGLGERPGSWPVPYWFGDAAFAVMSLLLLATEAGLGACFLGNFRGEAAVAHALGVPEGWRLFGAVLLGHPGDGDHRSPSLDRPGPAAGDRVHHGRW